MPRLSTLSAMVPRSAEMAPAVSTTISVMLPRTPQRIRLLTSSDAGCAMPASWARPTRYSR